MQTRFGSFNSGAQPGYAATCDNNRPVAILSISHRIPPSILIYSPEKPIFRKLGGSQRSGKPKMSLGIPAKLHQAEPISRKAFCQTVLATNAF
jgi:hypothetical protein